MIAVYDAERCPGSRECLTGWSRVIYQHAWFTTYLINVINHVVAERYFLGVFERQRAESTVAAK